MKYDIVEDDIKIGNKIIYGIDKDILDIIHSLEKENQELKRQKEELRDYLKARIEVYDNRLSTPFCNFEKATKERLILSQFLDKMEELEGVNNE